jgi:O-Antigen ligase
LSRKLLDYRTLLNPLTLLLAVSCLQWVYVAQIGTITVLVTYVALALVLLSTAVTRRRVKATFLYLRKNLAWLGPVLIYLIIMTLVLWGSKAQNFSPRQILYALGGIGASVAIITSRRPAQLFRVGAGLGILIFFIAVEFLARRVGLSWADAAREMFQRGNLNFVVYSFLNSVFNSVDPTSGDSFGGSTKNDVANALLMLALVFRAGSSRPHKDLVGMVVLSGCLVLLVMLNDRSVIIAAAASVLIATGVSAFVRPVSSLPILFAKLAAVLAMMITAVASLTARSGFFAEMNDRFSFNDKSTNARLGQYHGAVEMIGRHPITGNGFFTVNGFAVHDVFLYAWGYGGVIAFLLVVMFYVAVLWRWISFLFAVNRNPQSWVLPLGVEWIAPLPFVPLFRMWLSGEGGIMKFGEWMALSVFFGCLAANELCRRALRQAGQPVRSPRVVRPQTAAIVGAGH